jgi:transposase-like protein
MAGRATYTEEDKARAFVVLAANDGNVKRTARELSLPVGTLRSWRTQFEENPPDVALLEQAVTDFVGRATSVRDDALEVIGMKLKLLKEDPKTAKLAELGTVFGILTDKIDRASGVSQKVSHEHHLPPADEVRALMHGFVTGMQDMARAREEEIVEAEIVEQPALPKGS